MADTEVRTRKVNRNRKKKSDAAKQVDATVIPDQRDEGDGASIPEVVDELAAGAAPEKTLPVEEMAPLASPEVIVKPPSINMNLRLHLLPIILLAVGLATRFHALDEPKHVVFDELHYGRYAAHYLQNTFFFDSQPPLGKQLLALAGHLGGFKGDFRFEKIGQAYNASVPVFALRAIPALSGSLLIPLVYMIMVQIGYSAWTAALAGFLFLFDNALVTQSHYMLMEPMVLIFAYAGIFCTLKFSDIKLERSFTVGWWSWLLSSTVLLACSFCIKYVGIYSYLLGVVLIGRSFWNKILGNSSLSVRQLVYHTLARWFAVFVVPVFVYVAVFYVHLTTLTKAGPHDSAMSSYFQASLEGGLSSVISGQPLEVLHGSQITLRHTNGQPCWLHSHAENYPIKYADKRGSSHQQQVTCYPVKDVNNWWIVKRPNRSDLAVVAPYDRIQHGDLVQLVHGTTGRNLNSHNVAAPVSPTKQEISCYVDHNVSMEAQDIWRVEIANRDVVGDIWHAIESEVRFVHVDTNAAVAFSGRSLPEWGHKQFEVVGDPMINQPDTIFNVEEHRYTRNEGKEDRLQELNNNDFIPTQIVNLTFWEKFEELQIRMLFISNENVQNHMYTSSPWDWLTLTRGIAYWVSPTSNAQIHLLGNVMIWYSATIALAGYCGLLALYLLRRRRQCFDIDSGEWSQFCTTGQVLLLAYGFHFLPYFFVDHTLFLHHYMPALTFQLLLTAALVEHIYYLTRLIFRKALLHWMCILAILTWMSGILVVFNKFSPLCYGSGPMNASQILELKLRETWDFIIHKP